MAKHTRTEDVQTSSNAVDDTPQPAREPTVVPQSMAVEAWVRNKFGAKHLDQAAGFLHWCRKQKLKRLGSKEGAADYAQFTNKPV